VLNSVEAVIPGSPAAKAGLSPDDIIISGTLIPPGKEVLKKLDTEQSKVKSSSTMQIATGRC